ncbi:MAG TPA: efflux RND transporter periplasmic adaptor subunit [bacterium]|nr:efflux RND transporter periplasmic adaptor subunit [bacterium]HPN45425.1 efflux RND transporter periplasmic adaptor subunit [bacterium]
MKKWIFIPIVLIVAVIIWLVTKPGDARNVNTGFTPQTDSIKKGDIKVEVSATGIIQPINKVEIKSKASGLIEELPIEEADIVTKGELIARLDQRDTKNAYDQSVADRDAAEANVAFCESDYTRKKELYDRGLISATDFDQAKLSLVQAKAQLVRVKIEVDNNDIKLKDTIVRSPINGVILTKDVEIGQIISSGISSVSGGTLIATVAEMSEVHVIAVVDEVDIGRMRNGMKANVIADAFPNKVFQGEVIRIAAQATVEQNVTSFEVTIKVSNPGSLLKAGMNTAVEILVADKKDVLLIPNEALMTQKEMQQEIMKLNLAAGQTTAKPKQNGNEPRQYGQGNRPQESSAPAEAESLNRGVIIKQESGYRMQMVNTGISNFDYTEALDGVKEGDQVVYTYVSQSMQANSEMRERMIQRNAAQSGMRSQRSN